MKRWDVIISGYGTVGRQAGRLLLERQERYRKRYGADVRIVGALRSAAGSYDADGLTLDQLRAFSADAGAGRPEWTGTDFLESCAYHVLIEAGPSDIQTGGHALEAMRAALGGGKHVIAISKGALVADYPGLSALARENGVQLKVSGATAAALPTVDLLAYNLAGCEVSLMEGIFTGTANYVLTAMMDEQLSLTQAIERAQQMGIAEPDPRLDLEGWDTACKLTILANAAFGVPLRLSDVKREGIEQLTHEQLAAWRAAGLVPKLVGRLQSAQGRVEAAVELRLLEPTHPFVHVRGTTKAVRVETDTMGELLVIGGKSDPVAAAAAALKDLEHLLQQSG